MKKKKYIFGQKLKSQFLHLSQTLGQLSTSNNLDHFIPYFPVTKQNLI